MWAIEARMLPALPKLALPPETDLSRPTGAVIARDGDRAPRHVAS
jgi:hypothetical protein